MRPAAALNSNSYMPRAGDKLLRSAAPIVELSPTTSDYSVIHCESKNWATFIFTVTLANVFKSIFKFSQ